MPLAEDKTKRSGNGNGKGKRLSPSAPDWDALRARSLGKGGFGEERVEIWPRLLNVNVSPRTTPENITSATDAKTEPEPEAEPTPHEDERQIGLDTDRSFVLYPVESKLPRETLQRGLHALLVALFRKRPKLSYFQGYHDIVTVFYLTLPPSLQLPCVEKMSLHRLRDSMGHGLEPVLGLLRVTNNLLHLADPDYARLLEGVSPMPFYALSNLLTLFAHDMPTLPLIQHVFDYLLCRPPVAVVYLATAIILARKREAVQLEQDDEDGMIHSLLSSLPDLVDDHDSVVDEVKDEPQQLTADDDVYRGVKKEGGVKKEELEEGGVKEGEEKEEDGAAGGNTTFFAEDGGLNLEDLKGEVKGEGVEEREEGKGEKSRTTADSKVPVAKEEAGRADAAETLPPALSEEQPVVDESVDVSIVEEAAESTSTPGAPTEPAVDVVPEAETKVKEEDGLPDAVDPPPYSPPHSPPPSEEIKIEPESSPPPPHPDTTNPTGSVDHGATTDTKSSPYIKSTTDTNDTTTTTNTTDPLPSHPAPSQSQPKPNPKNKLILTDLLQHADALYATYPPSHPDIALSSIMGPQSVVYTWSESFSALSSDNECEAMVAHPELVVYPAVEVDTHDKEEEGSGMESGMEEKSRSRRHKGKVSREERRRRRRMLSSYKAPFGPVEKKTVLAGTVLVLGVAMAVYGIKASSAQPGGANGSGSMNMRDWKKVGGWVGGALAGISQKVLDVAAGSGHHGTP